MSSSRSPRGKNTDDSFFLVACLRHPGFHLFLLVAAFFLVPLYSRVTRSPMNPWELDHLVQKAAESFFETKEMQLGRMNERFSELEEEGNEAKEMRKMLLKVKAEAKVTSR